MNPYNTERAIRDLLREKYSSDEMVIDIFLENKNSLLGNRSPRKYVKDLQKLQADLGFTEEDAWRDIASIILKAYG